MSGGRLKGMAVQKAFWKSGRADQPHAGMGKLFEQKWLRVGVWVQECVWVCGMALAMMTNEVLVRMLVDDEMLCRRGTEKNKQDHTKK